MNQAILIKRKLSEYLSNDINERGRGACLWFDAYYNTGSVTQESQINSDLLVCDLHGIYQLDAILELGEQPASVQICDQVFHQDNIDRQAADEIWRHDRSPSLSVGDIVLIGDIEASRQPFYQTNSPEGFQAWICCQFGWRELTPAQRDLFRFKIRLAWIQMQKHRKASQAA